MITLLVITVGLVAGSLYGSRREFAEYLGVVRYRAFVREFPDHPAVQWHDEEMTWQAYQSAKRGVESALALAGAMILWPISIPAMLGLAAWERLTEKNSSMTNTIVIDYARIREEEGR
jgi:hypothetical protein